MKNVLDKSLMPVDVHNDAEMVAIGIRVPLAKPVDESVWTKTDAEKKELAKKRAVLKHYFDGTKGVSTAKKWSIPFRSKLIITIRNHPKFRKIKKNKKGEIVTNYKTTFSHVCGQSEIKNVLKIFDVYDKQTKSKVNLVEKYYWNGKEYAPDVLPAWGW